MNSRLVAPLAVLMTALVALVLVTELRSSRHVTLMFDEVLGLAEGAEVRVGGRAAARARRARRRRTPPRRRPRDAHPVLGGGQGAALHRARARGGGPPSARRRARPRRHRRARRGGRRAFHTGTDNSARPSPAARSHRRHL